MAEDTATTTSTETTGDALTGDAAPADGSALGGETSQAAETPAAAQTQQTQQTQETKDDSGSALGGSAEADSGAGSGTKDGGTSTTDTDSKADGEVSGAPDQYDDFSVPKGVKVEAKLIEDFAVWAKGNNLTQEQAQQVVTMQADAILRVSENSKSANETAVKNLNNSWVKEQKEDPEFGGEKHAASVAHARAGVKAIGGDALRKELDTLGIGNNPVLFRTFAKLGVALADDTIDFGNANAALTKDQRIMRLFPNSNLQPSS